MTARGTNVVGRLAVALGLVALSAAPCAAAETLFRARELTVHDAAGKKVGSVTPDRAAPIDDRGEDRTTVGFRLGSGALVTVEVTRPAIRPSRGLYYREPDCTGQPYVVDGGGDIAGARKTVYVPTAPLAFPPGSQWYALDSRGRCVTRVFPGRAAPAVATTVDLADYFTPPFSLRAIAGAAVRPIATGSAAAAEPEADDELFRADRSVVHDSRGVVVGPPGSAAFVTSAGRILVVEVTIYGSGFYTHTALRFDQPDCAGSAFLTAHSVIPNASFDYLAPRVAIVGRRSTVWADDGETPRRRTLRSTRVGTRCENYTVTVRSVRAVRTSIDFADYFTPPFSMRTVRGAPIAPR